MLGCWIEALCLAVAHGPLNCRCAHALRTDAASMRQFTLLTPLTTTPMRFALSDALPAPELPRDLLRRAKDRIPPASSLACGSSERAQRVRKARSAWESS